MRAASAGRDSARSLGQAGGECCRLEREGGRTTSRDRTGRGAEQRLVAPWLLKPSPEAWRSVGSPTPDTAAWGHSPDVPVWRDVIHCLGQKWQTWPCRCLVKRIPSTRSNARTDAVRARIPAPKTAWRSSAPLSLLLPLLRAPEGAATY